MALAKQIGTVYGVSASYWKITDVSLNSIDGTAHIVISGYYDQSTRIAGNQYMKQFEYNATAEQVQAYFPSGLDIAQIYLFIKAQSEFVFAEDC